MQKVDFDILSQEAFQSLQQYGLRENRNIEYQLINWAHEHLADARREWEMDLHQFFCFRDDELCTDIADHQENSQAEKSEGIAIKITDFIWVLLAWNDWKQEIDLNEFLKDETLLLDVPIDFEQYISYLHYLIAPILYMKDAKINALMALQTALLYFKRNHLDFNLYVEMKREFNVR